MQKQKETSEEKFIRSITEAVGKYYTKAISDAVKRGLKAKKENESKSNKNNTSKRK